MDDGTAREGSEWACDANKIAENERPIIRRFMDGPQNDATKKGGQSRPQI
jgi:hypothetical protein